MCKRILGLIRKLANPHFTYARKRTRTLDIQDNICFCWRLVSLGLIFGRGSLCFEFGGGSGNVTFLVFSKQVLVITITTLDARFSD